VTVSNANTAPFGALDTPANKAIVGGIVQVRGWALDGETPTANLTLTLLIDGNPVSAPLSRLTRTDVCGVYPETTYPGSCQSGFRLYWYTNGLTGSHTVAIRVTDAGGLTKVLGPRTVTVSP